MTRLIAFGCSNTYGVGLSDCWPTTSAPSKTAWPNILSNLLNIDETINNSIPGLSNKGIWKKILDYDFKENDIVFVSWSYITRHTVFNEYPVDDTVILPRTDSRITRFFYKYFYSDYDGMMELFNRSDHVARYLTNIGVKNFHTMSDEWHFKNIDQPKWVTFNFLNTNLDTLRNQHPYALDGSHPNQDAHTDFANDLHRLTKGQI